MRAVCIRTLIPHSETNHHSQDSTDTYDTKLVKGKTYVLYGLWISKGLLFYLIHEFEDIYYPLLMPAGCFSEPTGTMPYNWVMAHFPDDKLIIISSPIFRKNSSIYSEILEVEANDPLAQEWQHFRNYVDSFEIIQSG